MRVKSQCPQDRSKDRKLNIGDRVRLMQQIPFGLKCRVSITEGIVLDFAQEKTGAWFAHSRDKKLWLDRIVIRQDNGEISSCILDQYSRLEQIATAAVGQTTIKGWSKSMRPRLAIFDLVWKPLAAPSYLTA